MTNDVSINPTNESKQYKLYSIIIDSNCHLNLLFLYYELTFVLIIIIEIFNRIRSATDIARFARKNSFY